MAEEGVCTLRSFCWSMANVGIDGMLTLEPGMAVKRPCCMAWFCSPP